MALSSSRLAAEFSLRWICLRCSIEEAWRWLSSARSDAANQNQDRVHHDDNKLHHTTNRELYFFSFFCQIKALPSLAFPSSSSSKRNVCSSCSDCCLRMSRVLLWASFRAWTSSLCSCFKRSSKAWAVKHSRKKWGCLYSVKQEDEFPIGIIGNVKKTNLLQRTYCHTCYG